MDSFSPLECSERGKFLLSSGLLDISQSKISELDKSSYQNQDLCLEFETYKEAKLTFVVFATPPTTSRNGSCDSASTLVPGPESQDPNPFQFLCSKKIPSFSLHTPTFELFASAKEKLSELKSKLLKSKEPVIVTGAGLGGAVASLFTLWLLEAINPKLRRLLCITFDSPFIGDDKLQQILENSVSSSCFLHVVDAARTRMTADFFKPFGTFLIQFDSEGVCIEDAEAVMEMLVCWRDYGEGLQGLDQSSMADLRLKIDGIIKRMKERAEKKQRFDPFKKLDPMKILMMFIEWYKKKSKMAKIGYYDQYRSEIPTTDDIHVETLKKELNAFWTSVVEDADKKPQMQSDKAVLKRRFLFAGNNYRRMIEPLDIAEYYRKGGKEYQTAVDGRSRHYVMLEKWFREESDRSEKSDLSDLLTFDSCFWSKVEDSMIVIKSLKTHEGMRDEASIGKLVTFEEYVWELIKKREVSPEIFLEKSSFMRWWKEYKEIKGKYGFLSSTSEFSEFMDTRKYESYGKLESLRPPPV